MNLIVPVVYILSYKNSSFWLMKIQSAMLNINICPIEHLNENKKMSVELKIVDNTNPSHLATLPNLKWVQCLWLFLKH